MHEYEQLSVDYEYNHVAGSQYLRLSAARQQL